MQQRPEFVPILRNWMGGPIDVVPVFVFLHPLPISEFMWKTSITAPVMLAHFVPKSINPLLYIEDIWNSVKPLTFQNKSSWLSWILADLTPKEIIDSYIEKVHSGYWLCRACQTDFSCSGNARAHVESKHYTPGYTCPHCDKYYKIRNNFTQHAKKCSAKIMDLSLK